MKRLLAITALIASQLALAPLASAAEEKTATPQQQRMRDCNKEAKSTGIKGDERKAFMKQCLSGKVNQPNQSKPAAPPPSPKQAQQEKMKACNADAKTKALKGDARKAFMSDCLKN